MKIKLNFLNLLIALAVTFGPLGMVFSGVAANNAPQLLPFSQDWSNTGLITANDDWSGVLGIMGYRGDNLTSASGTDPQTILQPDDPGIIDVNANQTDPNTYLTGGVTEFAITDPVVALAGSGTADAPYLLILLNTTGMTTIQVSYDLRDLETGSDDAIQQVALHYRVGNIGNFTNIPEAYVADATMVNDVKTTHVSITLPSACNNAALVQLRIMTTNAGGNDEWVGVDNISITGTPAAGDTAPTVASTVPTDGGTSAKDGNLTITFSEPVTVAEGWFDITCSVSGTHTATVTDADPVYTLNPDADFTGGESCIVTINAANVTDDDTEDPPDEMAADYTFSFNVAYACGDPYTAISAIQGNGMSTPLSGQTVSTEGIVVADYQTNAYVSGTRNGFFMQSVTPDDDLDTSEGLFVYTTALDVAVGDHVRVTGKATEYSGLTQVSTISQILVCSSGNSVTPTSFALPATSLLDFERLEGMLVTIPQDLVISEYFNFDRYNEIVLATQRFMTYTAANEPSMEGFAAWLNEFKLNSITLDDGRETQNSDPAIHPNGQPFTLDNRFRGGDTVRNVTGVMDYEVSKYRIQPTQGATYTPANPRPETPELAPGFLKVASFNVLNYFTTIDLGTGHWICGPSGDMECRGADTAEELTRQRAKILAALSGIDADIFGIMEIENDRPLGEGESPDYAVADLVAGLNETYGEGTFAYIATGAIGTDAIKQAIIYKPAKVTPVNTFKLLTSAVDSRFIDTLNRPVLAQVFEDNFTGETFVVAVNHLKSKGSACPDDPDLLDGQGNCNLTRKAAAEALVDWLANPAYFPDMENALIIGDLNSYDHEDPIDMIKLGADDLPDTADDYSDMMAELHGEYAYGYVYDGQIGYLDYALANTSLAERIVDVNFWHINADEPDLIDYDMTFKQDAQDALYAPDAFRSSDHDPVVISLSFNAAPVANNMSINTGIGEPVQFTLAAYDPDGDSLTAEITSGPGWGQVSLNGIEVTYTPSEGFHGPDSFRYRVSDGLAQSNEATVVINVLAVANRAPVANNTRVSTTEDLAVQFILNANDPDGDPLTALISIPAHGQISMSGIEVTYTPDANYNGSDSFTYKVSDGELWSDTATVDITVTPVNDAPVANDVTETTAEDTAKTITLDATDIDSNTLTTEILSNPAHGEVSVSGLVVIYTPNANYNGLDSFTYKVSDGLLESNTATVTLTVNSVNDPPVLDPIGSQTVNEGSLLTFTATASDVDEGQTLTFRLELASAGMSIDPTTGVFEYSPGERDGGMARIIRVCVSDGVVSVCAYVSIEIVEVNDPPTLSPIGNLETGELIELSFTARARDRDYPPQTLIFSLANGLLGQVPEGATIGANSGIFTWTPTEEQSPGEYTFDVCVSDGIITVCETITITVYEALQVTALDLWTATDPTSLWTPVSGSYTDGFVMQLDPAVVMYYLNTNTITSNNPLASGMYPFFIESYPVSFFDYWASRGVVEGATGWQGVMWEIINGNAPIFYLQVSAGPIYKLVDGLSYQYSGEESYLRIDGNYLPGEYSFGGTVEDEIGYTDEILVEILFNDIPVAEDQTISTQEDTALEITLGGVDLYPGTLTWTVLSQPLHGTLSGTEPELTYTPLANYNGSDNFTFKVNDGMIDSNTATVSITVTSVNDAPVASDMTETTAEDTAKTITLDANDIDGDALTADILSNPTHGEVSVSGLGVTYTPDADYNGPDSFTYKVSDGELESDAATVNITVTPVNDAPMANDMTETTAEDTAKAITLNVSDIDGDTLTAEILSNPTHGEVSVSGIVVTYTPDANYNGPDSFTYKVSDGELWSDTATVDITVTPVNDAPVAESFEVELQENGSMTFTLLASDVDGDTLTFSLVSGTAHGTLNCAGVNCTYTPNPHWFGMDSFIFKANDGLLDSNEATVTLNVIPLPRIYLPIIFR